MLTIATRKIILETNWYEVFAYKKEIYKSV